MAATKMALESLFLRLETCPGPLCKAEIKTVQMRPSQPRSEVVTNWRIFQKPPRNQEKSHLPCTKIALVAKPWVHMTQETTQINPLVSSFDLPPWSWKSEPVTNWRIYQKLTAAPKMTKKISKCKKSNFSRQNFFLLTFSCPIFLILSYKICLRFEGFFES